VGGGGSKVDCSFCRGIREGGRGGGGYSTQKASSGGLLLRFELQQKKKKKIRSPMGFLKKFWPFGGIIQEPLNSKPKGS